MHIDGEVDVGVASRFCVHKEHGVRRTSPCLSNQKIFLTECIVTEHRNPMNHMISICASSKEFDLDRIFHPGNVSS
ncbi:GD21668 [Drosophila simulans]|uniref:GD21668 n=1 Tax=Drosophila simulans TaxID=7240 RepID=B4Q3W7_DROSI|nr:GD21668 [Drosophila simulans]